MKTRDLTELAKDNLARIERSMNDAMLMRKIDRQTHTRECRETLMPAHDDPPTRSSSPSPIWMEKENFGSHSTSASKSSQPCNDATPASMSSEAWRPVWNEFDVNVK